MLDAVGMFKDLLRELDRDFGEVVKALSGVEGVAHDEEVLVAAFELRNGLSSEVTEWGASNNLGEKQFCRLDMFIYIVKFL